LCHFLQVFHCVHFETPSQEAKLALSCSPRSPAQQQSEPDVLVVPAPAMGVDLSPRPAINMNPCPFGPQAERSLQQGLEMELLQQGLEVPEGAGAALLGAEGGLLDMHMNEDLSREMQDTPESERHDIEDEGNNSDIEGR